MSGPLGDLDNPDGNRTRTLRLERPTCSLFTPPGQVDAASAAIDPKGVAPSQPWVRTRCSAVELRIYVFVVAAFDPSGARTRFVGLKGRPLNCIEERARSIALLNPLARICTRVGLLRRQVPCCSATRGGMPSPGVAPG